MIGSNCLIRGLEMIRHRWGKFDEAETMLKRALVGYGKGLELGHLGTPRVVYIWPYSIAARESSMRQRRCGNGFIRAMRKFWDQTIPTRSRMSKTLV